jgi:hypothetical protein
MLNLEETLSLNLSYSSQNDFYLKGFLYSGGVIVFVEILRCQVAEVNLITISSWVLFAFTFYFFSLILIFLFKPLYLFSTRNRKIKRNTEQKQLLVHNHFILLKNSLFVFSFIILLVLNIVFPLSLDSFYSYGQKDLENIWSLNEVLGLETTLLFFFKYLISISDFS